MLGVATCESMIPNSSTIKSDSALLSSPLLGSAVPSTQNLSAPEIAFGVGGIVLGIIAIGVAVLQLKKMKRNRKVYFELA